MDEDGEAVDNAAREAVQLYGHGAVAALRERADLADHVGDAPSAETWRDIAGAAERMLRN